jgi:hypothetical protein
VRSSKLVVLITLGAAVGLGVFSTLSMRRAARQRTALTEEFSTQFPAPAQARLLVPWEPAPDSDLVHATYCLDDADAATAVARVIATLTADSWQVDAPPRAPSNPAAAALALSSARFQLRGVAQPGKRPDCDGARRQVALMLEAARKR